MRTGKKRTIELTWICSTCGRENRGRDTRCAGCGKPKEGEKYDMPGDTMSVPSVTDPEMLRQANAGKNWTCEYCGCQERGLNGQCKECGGEKAEPAKPVPVVTPPEPEDEPEYSLLRGSNIGRILTYAGAGIGGVIVVGSFIWLMVFLFGTHEVEAQVASIRWQHTVTLEQRYTLNGSGWDSNMPASAFNVSCQTKQHGTENCRPHDCNSRTESYDCNPHECNCHQDCHEDCTNEDNGYATCEQDCEQDCDTCYETCEREVHDTCYDRCPVYDEWCAYNYYEWRAEQTKLASGTTHDENWPALNAFGETQRLQKSAAYSVNFRDDEDSWNYSSPNLSDFRRFNPSERWLLKVNRAGMSWPQKRL